MPSAAVAKGSAERWGPLWGTRPKEWARNEEAIVPGYREAIRRLDIASGQSVLDIGCGTGVFLREAAAAGANPFGLDASEALLEIARERLPEADLRHGDMQFMPYADHSFDVVTGFNSFFFAADMTAALREAGRVAKPGAPVLIQVWGRPERCDLDVMKRAAAPHMPTPPASMKKGPKLWDPGVLEQMASDAGLTPEKRFDLSYAFEYANEKELADLMLSAGGMSVVVQTSEDELRAAIVDGLRGFRQPDGSYRLENEWLFLVARA